MKQKYFLEEPNKTECLKKLNFIDFIKSYLDKFRTSVIQNVTVEPLLPLYIIASVMTALAAQNLYLDKACRVNLQFGDEVCDALMKRETRDFKMQEIEVQKMVAKMQAWKTVLQTFFPCILILFVGSWSDRNLKRKPCMLIPVFGELLSSAGLILNVYYSEWPMEVAGVTEAFFEGITGGWATMLMASFSYIADITTEENRTFRIGITNTCFSVGVAIALSVSGVLLKNVGFYGSFGISVAIHISAFLYAFFCIKEVSAYKSNQISPNTNESTSKSVVKSKKNICADFFDPTNAIDTFKVGFKRGRRARILIFLIAVLVIVGPMHGEQAVIYLFTRFKFNWNEVDYSLFGTFSTVVTGTGVILAIFIFSRLLKMHDALIGIFASCSKILASFVYAFASTGWQFYFGPVVEIIHNVSFIVMRSIASKMVEQEERGRLNSLVGVIEALAPSLYGPIYSQLYAATLTTFPGAFFLVGGGLKTFALIIFLWMYMEYRSKKRTEDSLVATEGTQPNTYLSTQNSNYI